MKEGRDYPSSTSTHPPPKGEVPMSVEPQQGEGQTLAGRKTGIWAYSVAGSTGGQANGCPPLPHSRLCLSPMSQSPGARAGCKNTTTQRSRCAAASVHQVRAATGALALSLAGSLWGRCLEGNGCVMGVRGQGHGPGLLLSSHWFHETTPCSLLLLGLWTCCSLCLVHFPTPFPWSTPAYRLGL